MQEHRTPGEQKARDETTPATDRYDEDTDGAGTEGYRQQSASVPIHC